MSRHIGYLFIAPAFVILFFTSIYPVAFSFYFSFFDWNWGNQENFIGLENYLFLLTDPEFWTVIYNTFVFASISCFLEVTIGIILAIFVDRIVFCSTVIRTILILPLMVSGIIVSMISKIMFNNLFGVIPYGLKQIDIRSSFFGSTEAAMPTLIGVDVWWQTSFVFIIILAALQGIPNDTVEAAKIDGASEWDITRFIRLPLIKPIIFLVIIFRSIDTLKIFDLVWGITGGGPGISTEVVQTYSYRMAFGFLEMSKSMTVMVIFSMVVFTLILIYSKFEGKSDE